MRLLLIKTSALGDVVNALPAVSDMARAVPDLELHWMVEAAFAEIPRLHPATAQVVPVSTRRWRRRPLARETREEFAVMAKALRAGRYDLVVDAQGLIRSAVLARLAAGVRCGFDAQSVREPPASFFYDRRFRVGVELHAIERVRRLAGQALGYAPPAELDYGVAAEPARPSWLPARPYLVALHGTARADKLWDESNWIGLGQRAAAEGLSVVLLWGSKAERERSERLAAAIPAAVLPPAMTLTEIAGMMAGAAAVAGVDTGLAHLAAAVGAPVVALFLATWPGLNGVMGPGFTANLGGPDEAPSVEEAWAATAQALRSPRVTGPWLPAATAPGGAGRRRFRPSNARAKVHGR
ncbi:MAG: lipopolysaccharide heptosyltransferase I [Caulobacteraceae bacterium]|nr:lipopolysaccharide heptosyltransferase I [Caulobacteraceae bacterium]